MVGYRLKTAAAGAAILALCFAAGGEKAIASPVPYQCVLSGDGLSATIFLTNTLNADASCLVNCKYATAKFGDNPEITCAKPVPAGKQVEMCVLHSSSGATMTELNGSRGDCSKL